MDLLYIYTHKGYNPSFLEKDVGMAPSFLSKKKPVNSLFFGRNKKRNIIFRNLNITFTYSNWLKSNIKAFSFLYSESKKNKNLNLFLFHLSMRNIICIGIYRFLFNGKIICKLDLNTRTAYTYRTGKETSYLKRVILRWMIKKTDTFYVETQRNYNLIINNCLGVTLVGKLKLMPNGINKKNLELIKYGRDIKKEKKIIIITRYDSELKCPDRIFDIIKAMKELVLNDWSLKIIGEFPEFYTNKINSYAEKKNVNVDCYGKNIDIKDVYLQLNSSSIFLCLSDEESYCISLIEAAVFNNNIISTDVGVAEDLSKNYKRMTIIKNYSYNTLKISLEKLTKNFHGERCYLSDDIMNIYSWENIINKAKVV